MVQRRLYIVIVVKPAINMCRIHCSAESWSCLVSVQSAVEMV